ncbi:hypothetical protein CYL31_08840 [Marinomonas sp. A3A]|uniref:hypothetical protein n=1 Tax=Marinomonas sp. A3A TaxID=2065312 RepID=UPI001BB2F65B|nr:hypothetical protein [Marinomonas sp. A3A]QUX91520.1 hypothetical protein CYL31_08840 [Marinomonas sp. A3A]
MRYIVTAALLVFSVCSYADGVDNWNFNLGIGVEQYRSDYIDQAKIAGDERIVVVEKEYQTRPSAWLTLSWNFWGLGDPVRTTQNAAGNNIDIHNVKFGLFVGAKILGENATSFESFALGPQITFQAEDRDISVGLGWVTHPTRELASGISEGGTLPSQFDDITYKEGTENSYMLMFSIAL